MGENNIFPIDRSYILLNLKCLTVIGAFNPYDSGLKYWLYRLYIIYYNYGIFPIKCLGDFLQTLDAHTLPQFTQAFASVIVHLSGAVKTFNIVNARAEILLLAELFNWERYLECTPQMAEYRNKVITKAAASTRTVTIVIVGIVLQNSIADLYSTLTVANCTLTDYPLSYLPIDYIVPSIDCRTLAISDYVVHNFASANIIINDSFLMALMVYITVQLKLLNYRFRNCHKTAIESFISTKLNEKKTKIIIYECRKISSDKGVLDPNVELIKCIENHKKILEIFETFKTIYNNILLPQLFSSLAILSLMGCQMILTKYTKNEDVHDMVHPLVFCIWGTLELYVYCNGGNNILIESEEIRNSAYNAEWYDADKQFKDNLTIFIGLVNKPLVISAGGVIDLTTITFKNVLTKAYSFMAILKNSSS